MLAYDRRSEVSLLPFLLSTYFYCLGTAFFGTSKEGLFRISAVSRPCMLSGDCSKYITVSWPTTASSPSLLLLPWQHFFGIFKEGV
jgi:hypothetical protein